MTSLLKKRIKARMEIEVEAIEGLDKLKGQQVFIQYSRGTSLSGTSEIYKVESPEVKANYKFSFELSLFYSESRKADKKFQPKKLSLSLRLPRDGKKPVKLGTLEYDLAAVATPGKFEPRQKLALKGKDKKAKKLILVTTFQTEWLKIDGKKLVKREAPKVEKPEEVTEKKKKKKKKSKRKSAAEVSESKKDLPDDLYDNLPDFDDDDFSDSTNRSMTLEGEKYDLVTDMDMSEITDNSEWVDESEAEFFSDDEFSVDDSEQDTSTEEQKHVVEPSALEHSSEDEPSRDFERSIDDPSSTEELSYEDKAKDPLTSESDSIEKHNIYEERSLLSDPEVIIHDLSDEDYSEDLHSVEIPQMGLSPSMQLEKKGLDEDSDSSQEESDPSQEDSDRSQEDVRLREDSKFQDEIDRSEEDIDRSQDGIHRLTEDRDVANVTLAEPIVENENTTSVMDDDTNGPFRLTERSRNQDSFVSISSEEEESTVQESPPVEKPASSSEDASSVSEDTPSVSLEENSEGKKKKRRKKGSRRSVSRESIEPSEYGRVTDALNEKLKTMEAEYQKKLKKRDKKLKALETKLHELKNENEELREAHRRQEATETSREGDQALNVEVSERVSTLEYQALNWERIVNLFYNAPWEYNHNNLNDSAVELASIIVDEEGLESHDSDKDRIYDLTSKLLVNLFKRAKSMESSLFQLIGLLKWTISLLHTTLEKTNISDDLKSDYHITWVTNIKKNGIILRISDLHDGEEVLNNYNVEKEFDSKIEEDGLAMAFVDILDAFLSVIYATIITIFQDKFDESKIIDLYFMQRIQTNTLPVKPKVSHSYIINQLDNLLTSLRHHHIEESIQAQMLAQFFHWNSVVVVNSLINIAELCTASGGLSIKMACSHIEQWLHSHVSKRSFDFIIETLLPMKEGANVLTIDKNSFDDESLFDNVFVHLNVAQIYQILEHFSADDFSDEQVSEETLNHLQNVVRNSNAKVTHFDVNLINY